MSAYHAANASYCQENMHHISTALAEYAQDWDQTLPASANWADAISKRMDAGQVRNRFKCKETTTPYSYLYNSKLSGLGTQDLERPYETPAIYEGRAFEFNAASDGIEVPFEKRHMGGGTVGFADGHARHMTEWSLSQLGWPSKLGPQKVGPQRESTKP